MRSNGSNGYELGLRGEVNNPQVDRRRLRAAYECLGDQHHGLPTE